jgi:hypothetical protein
MTNSMIAKKTVKARMTLYWTLLQCFCLSYLGFSPKKALHQNCVKRLGMGMCSAAAEG